MHESSLAVTQGTVCIYIAHLRPHLLTVDTLAYNVEETVQQVQHPYADEVEPVGRDQPDHREPDPANL